MAFLAKTLAYADDLVRMRINRRTLESISGVGIVVRLVIAVLISFVAYALLGYDLETTKTTLIRIFEKGPLVLSWTDAKILVVAAMAWSPVGIVALVCAKASLEFSDSCEIQREIRTKFPWMKKKHRAKFSYRLAACAGKPARQEEVARELVIFAMNCKPDS